MNKRRKSIYGGYIRGSYFYEIFCFVFRARCFTDGEENTDFDNLCERSRTSGPRSSSAPCPHRVVRHKNEQRKHVFLSLKRKGKKKKKESKNACEFELVKMKTGQ